MEPLPIPAVRWRSRTPVRRGHFDKPNWKPRSENRIGNGPSTVEGRVSEKLYDEQYRNDNPHLQPGMLVIRDRTPYRIVETREYPADLWPQNYQDEWDKQFGWWLNDPRDRPQPDKATWRDRPVVVVLTPDGGDKEQHLLYPASRVWDVLPEHYAVCRSCGELPPCREEEIDKATGRQMAETLRLMAIQPGACMGCGETISGRQKSVAFPGPNLWRPDLADGTVRFHARQECDDWVRRYRKQWEAAGKPGFVSAVEQLAMGEDAR
jgi:hypothetical protein